MSLSARTESKLLIAAGLILIEMEDLIIYSSIQARVRLRSGISLGLSASEAPMVRPLQVAIN